MKITQLDLFDSPSVPASSVKMGDVFLFLNRVHIRTKPVSWMLNSTLIQDKLAKGFIFATDLETGKFSTIDGAFLVEPVKAILKWGR